MNKTMMKTAAQRRAAKRSATPTPKAARAGMIGRGSPLSPESVAQLRADAERQTAERLAALRLRLQSAIVDLNACIAPRPRRCQEL